MGRAAQLAGTKISERLHARISSRLTETKSPPIEFLTIANILRIDLQFLVVRTGQVRACKNPNFLGSGLECTAIAIVIQNYTS